MIWRGIIHQGQEAEVTSTDILRLRVSSLHIMRWHKYLAKVELINIMSHFVLP